MGAIPPTKVLSDLSTLFQIERRGQITPTTLLVLLSGFSDLPTALICRQNRSVIQYSTSKKVRLAQNVDINTRPSELGEQEGGRAIDQVLSDHLTLFQIEGRGLLCPPRHYSSPDFHSFLQPCRQNRSVIKCTRAQRRSSCLKYCSLIVP